MASSTFGEHVSSGDTVPLPRQVRDALHKDAQAKTYAALVDHIGDRVLYRSLVSVVPKAGTLLVISSRTAMIRWDDGLISTAPFMSRLELEQ